MGYNKIKRKLSNMKWQKANLEKCSEKTRRHRAKLRHDMIVAYGGKCKCCGETEYRFLTLDHINQDGAIERGYRKNGKHKNNYSVWYRLKRTGWPKKNHQVLCYNCNCGRAFNNGICPHKER